MAKKKPVVHDLPIEDIELAFSPSGDPEAGDTEWVPFSSILDGGAPLANEGAKAGEYMEFIGRVRVVFANGERWEFNYEQGENEDEEEEE